MSRAPLCVRASWEHKAKAMSGHTQYIIQFTSSQLVSAPEPHRTGLFVFRLHHFTPFRRQLIIKNAALQPYGALLSVLILQWQGIGGLFAYSVHRPLLEEVSEEVLLGLHDMRAITPVSFYLLGVISWEMKLKISVWSVAVVRECTGVGVCELVGGGTAHKKTCNATRDSNGNKLKETRRWLTGKVS